MMIIAVVVIFFLSVIRVGQFYYREIIRSAN
jgi:hypothetical protein